MMPSKHRVAPFLGNVVSCHLKRQNGWWHLLFGTEAYLFRSCAQHCFTASDESGGIRVGHNPPLTDLPIYRCLTIGEYSYVHSVGGSRGLSTVKENAHQVEGKMSMCMFSAKNYVRKESLGRATVSAVPGSIIKGPSAADAIFSQARSLKTAVMDVAELREDSISSPESPRRRLPRRKGGPCHYDGCKVKSSNYGFPDEEPTSCWRHMLEGMVISHKGCKEKGCNRQAAFNFPGHAGVVRCSAHQLVGMVCKTHSLCRSSGCTRAAAYGSAKETQPSYCKTHAASDMIQMHHRSGARCHWESGCMERAVYGHASDGVRRLCWKHREAGMVNLRRCCEKPGCTKLAFHGWPGRRVWLRCSVHKEPGMVRTETCSFEGCEKHPSFGFEGDKRGSRCAAHRENGMQQLVKNVCTADGCVTCASFGFEGDKRASRCAAHKEGGMRLLKRNVCAAQGCTTSATFGFEGDKRASRCAVHREDSMRRLMKDMCAAQGCATSATYGFEGDKRASRCGVHREEGMWCMKQDACAVQGCSKCASFGFEGDESASRCGAHKEKGMRNLWRARRRGVPRTMMVQIAEVDALESQKRETVAAKLLPQP